MTGRLTAAPAEAPAGRFCPPGLLPATDSLLPAVATRNPATAGLPFPNGSGGERRMKRRTNGWADGPAVAEQCAERGVYAAESPGWNGVVQTSQNPLSGARCCGLKAALLTAPRAWGGALGLSANGAATFQPGATPQEPTRSQNSGLKARPIVPPWNPRPRLRKRACSAGDVEPRASWGVYLFSPNGAVPSQPRAKRSAALGGIAYGNPALKARPMGGAARENGSPLQGCGAHPTSTQGVALGWYGNAPLGLNGYWGVAPGWNLAVPLPVNKK